MRRVNKEGMTMEEREKFEGMEERILELLEELEEEVSKKGQRIGQHEPIEVEQPQEVEIQ